MTYINTGTYVKKLYSTALAKAKIHDKQWDKKAEVLTEFFREIQAYQIMLNGGNSNLMENLRYQSLILALNKVTDANGVLKPLFGSQSLSIIGKGDDGSKTGALLEAFTARVIENIEGIATGTRGSGALVGLEQVTIENEFLKDKIYEDLFYAGSNSVRAVLEEDISSMGNNIPVLKKRIKPHLQVQGKIDIKGLKSDFKVTADTGIEGLDEIVDALRGANFTAKNYASNYDIHFGHTNPFRVYMTYGSSYAHLKRWFQMLSCFYYHDNHSIAKEYFLKLRIIYEITGSGMRYSNESTGLNGSSANLLIWNTPRGASSNYTDIKVIPTYKIVDAFLEMVNKRTITANEALYEPIVMPQIDLSRFA